MKSFSFVTLNFFGCTLFSFLFSINCAILFSHSFIRFDNTQAFGIRQTEENLCLFLANLIHSISYSIRQLQHQCICYYYSLCFLFTVICIFRFLFYSFLKISFLTHSLHDEYCLLFFVLILTNVNRSWQHICLCPVGGKIKKSEKSIQYYMYTEYIIHTILYVYIIYYIYIIFCISFFQKTKKISFVAKYNILNLF